MRHLPTTIALVLATLPSGGAAEPVTTRAGIVEGVTQADGMRAWLGIPYAAPPVGDLRWKPPRPASPWPTTYPATRFAPSCMQPLRDHGIAYYVGDDPVAEDCLYLNVWAPPAARGAAPRPVIVFIHGGSFVAGSARKPLYVGDRLAAKGAIVVGINYRLGALGFLAHTALTAESPDHASGNYGLLDQIAALRWVRDNIAAFGGDPQRVTVMGQSAGAISIALLQTSPLAKGLFHRIVALSGSPYSSPASDRTPTLAMGEAQGDTFRRSLGVTYLAAMHRLPADRIVAAQGPAASPIVDGLAITSPPAKVYAAGRQVDVPILLGVTADEALGPLSNIATLAAYRAATARLFGDRADDVMRLYPADNDRDAASAARALAHDSGFSTMMRSWARMQAAHGRAPVYAYVFERRHPYTPGVAFSDLDPATAAVNHTDDVPYWLGTFDSLNGPRRTRDWTPADHMLGERMQAAIVAFAATGNPNTPALGLSWPRYDLTNEKMVAFGDGVRVCAWPNRASMDRLTAMGIPDPGTAKEQRK